MPSNVASSVRRLAAGAPATVTPYYSASKPWRFVFSTGQHFYRGETLAVANAWEDAGMLSAAYATVTIAFGAGTEWVSFQRGVHPNYGFQYSPAGFWRTDPSTSRLRGPGGGGDTAQHRLVPDAVQYLYVSPLNGSGAVDWYTYVDTIFPINGRHPYTKDRWTGRSWISRDVAPYVDGLPVPDTASRMAALDADPPVLSR